MSQTACAAPPQRLRRLLLLSDVYGWTLALLTLLLCLLILPLPLLGVRTLLLMPVSFLALLPVLYGYRGLTIRSVAPLPKVSAPSRLALLRTHLCSVTALHAVGCLLFVLASVGAAIAIVLPLLSPCAEAVEPDGLTARAVLACCWALAAGAVPAMRACASPTFARLPWHDAASPAALRLRARLVRLAPEALRASTVLFAVGLALSPAVLALARPRFDGTALLLVDGCRAFPLTRGAVGPPPSTVGEEDDPTPSPSGATPAELATFALLRQLSLRSYLRMLLSAAWFHFLLHAALALVRLAYGRRISLACPPSVSRQSSSSAPLPRSAASGAATAAGTVVGSFGPPVAAPRSAAALGGEGEGLLLRALLTDEACTRLALHPVALPRQSALSSRPRAHAPTPASNQPASHQPASPRSHHHRTAPPRHLHPLPLGVRAGPAHPAPRIPRARPHRRVAACATRRPPRRRRCHPRLEGDPGCRPPPDRLALGGNRRGEQAQAAAFGRYRRFGAARARRPRLARAARPW